LSRGSSFCTMCKKKIPGGGKKNNGDMHSAVGKHLSQHGRTAAARGRQTPERPAKRGLFPRRNALTQFREETI